VPLVVNSVLVVNARVLGRMAEVLGHRDEAQAFRSEADVRVQRIRQYCWSDQQQTFLEYDYLAQKHIPVYSDGCFWALWAGVATPSQAAAVVSNLQRFEKRFGLTVTDKAYPDPHRDAVYKLLDGSGGRADTFVAPDSPDAYHGGRSPLMWMYPAGWATTQIIVAGVNYFFLRIASPISLPNAGRCLTIGVTGMSGGTGGNDGTGSYGSDACGAGTRTSGALCECLS
jgi:neutral trehalase